MKTEFTEAEVKKAKRRGIGCLSVIAIIVIFIITAYLNYEPSPLEKIFQDNDLGLVENVVEDTWKTNGKILNFETRKIKYKAYIEEDGTPYQIFVGKGKSFPIYDVSNNDTVIDENEKLIIDRMISFMDKSSKTYSGLIPEIKADIESQLNFPDTFSCKNIQMFDMGKYYILNITFTAKNAFGMKLTNVAKYKMNFETNTYSLIEIL